MTKYKVIIAEDENILLKELYSFFEEISDFEVINTFSDSSKAYDWINENMQNFDILVTDIEMQGDNDGFTLANKANKPTIFISGKVSAHVKSFESINLDSENQIEFLTKPATLEKLKKSLKKLGTLKPLKSSEWFHVKREGQRGVQEKIELNDILYIKPAENGRNNKECFLKNGKVEILIDYSHEKLKDILPFTIYAIGKGIFISNDGIQTIKGNDIYFKTELSESVKPSFIKISKDYKKEFDSTFKNH